MEGNGIASAGVKIQINPPKFRGDAGEIASRGILQGTGVAGELLQQGSHVGDNIPGIGGVHLAARGNLHVGGPGGVHHHQPLGDASSPVYQRIPQGVEGIETAGVHQEELAAIYSDAGAVALIVVNIFGGILPGDADGAGPAFRSRVHLTDRYRAKVAHGRQDLAGLPLGQGEVEHVLIVQNPAFGRPVIVEVRGVGGVFFQHLLRDFVDQHPGRAVGGVLGGLAAGGEVKAALGGAAVITIRSHRAVAVIEVHFAYQAAGGGIDAFLLDAVGKAVEQLAPGQ